MSYTGSPSGSWCDCTLQAGHNQVPVAATNFTSHRLCMAELHRYDVDLVYSPMIMADSFISSAKARDTEFTTNAGACVHGYFDSYGAPPKRIWLGTEGHAQVTAPWWFSLERGRRATLPRRRSWWRGIATR